MIACFNETGYDRIISKSDNEPAILALKADVKQHLKGVEVIPQEAPTGDHNANGAVEVAVRDDESIAEQDGGASWKSQRRQSYFNLDQQTCGVLTTYHGSCIKDGLFCCTPLVGGQLKLFNAKSKDCATHFIVAQLLRPCLGGSIGKLVQRRSRYWKIAVVD